MEKLIRDGNVAVITGSGYGENWGTHVGGSGLNDALFSPRLVQAILGETNESVRSVARELFPQLCEFGAPELVVEWVPVGVRFFILEEDGKETLWREDEIPWQTA